MCKYFKKAFIASVFVPFIFLFGCGGGSSSSQDGLTTTVSSTTTTSTVLLPPPPQTTPPVSTATTPTPVTPIDTSARRPGARPPSSTLAPLAIWLRTNTEKYEIPASEELFFAETETAPEYILVNNEGINVGVDIPSQNKSILVGIFPRSGIASVKPGDLIRLTGFGKFSLFGGGRVCGNNTQAVVFFQEIEFDNNKNITKLAFDFLVNCTGNPLDVLEGAYRFRSKVPLVSDVVLAVPFRDEITQLEGRSAFLDGSFSWAPSEILTKHEWRQISGPPLDISNCNKSVCLTYTPKVPAGGQQAIVELTVTTESGKKAKKQLVLNIRSHLDKQSRYEISGNGSLASGGTYFGNELDGDFSFRKKWSNSAESVDSQYSEQISGIYNGTFLSNFSVAYTKGQAISPGYFYSRADAGFEPTDYFGFQIGNDYRSCQGLGEGYISQIDRNPQDLTKVNSFGMWFEKTCSVLGFDEEYSSTGIIWVNYKPSNSPFARIVGPEIVSAGSSVILSGRQSSDVNGYIRRYYWYRILGQNSVNYTSPDGADLFITIPPSTKPGEQLVYTLEVVDNEGNTAVQVHKFTIR